MRVHGRAIEEGKDHQGDLLYQVRKYFITRQSHDFLLIPEFPG